MNYPLTGKRRSIGLKHTSSDGLMICSSHKSESQYIKYIRCSLDEYAEMVAAANDKDGDNLF